MEKTIDDLCFIAEALNVTALESDKCRSYLAVMVDYYTAYYPTEISSFVEHVMKAFGNILEINKVDALDPHTYIGFLSFKRCVDSYEYEKLLK